MSRPWDSSLLGCLDDFPSYYYIFYYPFGLLFIHLQVSSKASSSNVYERVVCCNYFGCALNRRDIRRELGISGNYLGDCFAWYFCPNCAASQEYREWLKYRKNVAVPYTDRRLVQISVNTEIDKNNRKD